MQVRLSIGQIFPPLCHERQFKPKILTCEHCIVVSYCGAVLLRLSESLHARQDSDNSASGKPPEGISPKYSSLGVIPSNSRKSSISTEIVVIQMYSDGIDFSNQITPHEEGKTEPLRSA
jgi:hypothetical protein